MIEEEYKTDCLRIQRICAEHGECISLDDAYHLWDKHSEMFAAGWLFLPDNDEDVWEELKMHGKKCPTCGRPYENDC